jgi:Bacteriocin-protection, YdeI or OmpD-Associated
MALNLTQKLRIKDGMKLLAIHAPGSFGSSLKPLPPGVTITTTGSGFQQIHWFVKNKSEMEKDLDKVLKLVKGDVVCWIYYPKGTSSIQTDLTRDKGWEQLLKRDELQWLSLISFDDTWSAFGMRAGTDDDKKKQTKPAENPVLEFIDATRKIVHLPDDLASALRKNKKALTFYETLSFTNKKEYVSWVVSAKREETRKERVKASAEKLEKNWKNPGNR